MRAARTATSTAPASPATRSSARCPRHYGLARSTHSTRPPAPPPHRAPRPSPGPVPARPAPSTPRPRSEEHTSELQSRQYLVCRLLLEKKKNNYDRAIAFLQGRGEADLNGTAALRVIADADNAIDV